jgi:hypothetical protein
VQADISVSIFRKVIALIILVNVLFAGEDLLNRDNGNTSVITAHSSDKIDESFQVKSVKDAKAISLKYTGIDKLGLKSKANEIECKLVVIADNKTPFTSKKIDGNQIWEVKIPKVPIGKGEKTIERDFKVYLEPATGQLLKIISISDEVGSSDTLPEPTASKAEEYLQKRGFIYNGLPNQLPIISLTQALLVCPLNPETAKVIKALYVDHSANGTPYPNAWIIILRGTESLMMVTGPSPEQIPINQRNSSLFVVDAVTGTLEYGINAPRDREQIKRDKNMK